MFAIILIGHLYWSFKRFYFFMKYGGEFISHEQDESGSIEKIYKELKKKY